MHLATTTRLLPWAGAGALWGASFALSCALMAQQTPGCADGVESVAGVLLGQSRRALGQQMYMTADLYFHRGVPHLKERAFDEGFVPSLAAEVSPALHDHLRGKQIGEIMPWMWLSLRMDPHNLETYRVAAFWLATDARRPDLARKVLLDAQANNPYAYQVQLDMGRMDLREGLLEDAARDFDAALAFWPRRTATDEELEKLERAEILLYRALLHEARGETEREVRMLEEILAAYPDRSGLRERIDVIRSGGKPALPADRLWDLMLKKQRDAMHDCGRGDDGHAHEHEHGHGDENEAGGH